MKKGLFEKARKELSDLEAKGKDKKAIGRLRRFIDSFENLKKAQAAGQRLPRHQRPESELDIWGSKN